MIGTTVKPMWANDILNKNVEYINGFRPSGPYQKWLIYEHGSICMGIPQTEAQEGKRRILVESMAEKIGLGEFVKVISVRADYIPVDVMSLREYSSYSNRDESDVYQTWLDKFD